MPMVRIRQGPVTHATAPSEARPGMWALTALLAVGTVMNAASSSRWERFGWAPLVLGLTLVCLQLGRSEDKERLPEPGIR